MEVIKINGNVLKIRTYENDGNGLTELIYCFSVKLQKTLIKIDAWKKLIYVDNYRSFSAEEVKEVNAFLKSCFDGISFSNIAFGIESGQFTAITCNNFVYKIVC